MGSTFLVDDSNPSVVYGGNSAWTEGFRPYSAITNDFNSTVHWATTNGPTITYKFHGTGITVYGTIDQPGKNGLPGSRYTLDANPPVAINSTGEVPYPDPDVTYSHIPFFSATSLSASEEHTLTITVTDATDAKRYIFDYFAVETTVDTSSSSAVDSAAAQFAGKGDTAIMVDDEDKRIVYRVDDDNREWTTTDHPSATRRTAHVPPVPLKTADGTAIFFFNGTSVEVFGTVTYVNATIDPTSPALRLSLYKGYSITPQGASVPFTPPSAAQYSVLQRLHVSFGRFAGLSNAEYRLHIENTNTDRGVTWDLDYIIYNPISGSSSTGGGGAVTTTTDSNGVPVPVPTSSNSQPSGASVSPTQTKPTPKAAVAGGVVGALLAIALLALLFWFYRKRKSNNGPNGLGHQKKPKWALPFVIKRRDTAARAYEDGGQHIAPWDDPSGGERNGQQVRFLGNATPADEEQPRWVRTSSVGGEGAVVPLTPVGRYRESRKTRSSARRTREIPIGEEEVLVIGHEGNQTERTPAVLPHRGHSGFDPDEKQALGLPSPPPLGGGPVQTPYTIPSAYFGNPSPPPTGSSDPMATSTTFHTATTTTNNSTSIQPRSSTSDSGGRAPSHTGSSSGRGRSSMSQSGQSYSGQSRSHQRRRRRTRPLQETDGGVQLDTWENYARGPASTGRSDIDSGSESYSDSEVMSGTLPPPYIDRQNL